MFIVVWKYSDNLIDLLTNLYLSFHKLSTHLKIACNHVGYRDFKHLNTLKTKAENKLSSKRKSSRMPLVIVLSDIFENEKRLSTSFYLFP